MRSIVMPSMRDLKYLTKLVKYFDYLILSRQSLGDIT